MTTTTSRSAAAVHAAAGIPRRGARRTRARVALVLGLGLAGLLGTTIVVAATLGPARIPIHTSAGILLDLLGVPTPWAGEVTDVQRQIVLAIRLPRIVTAALVGAGLAVVGTVLQALFRNPMADPGVIGVSAGGGLGAVLAITSSVTASHPLALPAAAFLGSLSATLAVFGFSVRRGRSHPATLLLAGIAVTYLGSAATTALISLTAERDTLREIVFWLLGGFENRGWEHALLVAPPVLVGAALLLGYGRALNLLVLGEEEAQGLGLAVHRTRLVLLVVTALITGAAVAVSGPVGFVGLVVPHLVRLLARTSDHRLVLPLAGLGGAVFLLLADTLARVVVQPAELRVGVVTALVGAPGFLGLLARARRDARYA